jgi:acyl-coenzyme A synthetase/AMP-(fatty) acid ligase
MQDLYIDLETDFKKKTLIIFQIFKHILKNKGYVIKFSLNKTDKSLLISSFESFKKKVKRNKLIKVSKIKIFTSGSTGKPKSKDIKINYKIKTLNYRKYKWLLTYSPLRWAGISMILHTISFNEKLIIPKNLETQNLIRSMHQVSAISLTPSLFKKILLFLGKKKFFNNIKQVTFGGEYVDQDTLNLAKKKFPYARLTSVYALTEFGDICSCSDGKEGFPNKKFRKYEFKNKVLFINGKSTGDMWIKRNNRYFFYGRENDVINIGGNKISLQIVKKEFLKIKKISLFRLNILKNPILGNVITADYVGNIDEKELQKKLIKVLPKFAIPIQYNKVKDIKLKNNKI